MSTHSEIAIQFATMKKLKRHNKSPFTYRQPVILDPRYIEKHTESFKIYCTHTYTMLKRRARFQKRPKELMRTICQKSHAS